MAVVAVFVSDHPINPYPVRKNPLAVSAAAVPPVIDFDAVEPLVLLLPLKVTVKGSPVHFAYKVIFPAGAYVVKPAA